MVCCTLHAPGIRGVVSAAFVDLAAFSTSVSVRWAVIGQIAEHLW